MKRKPFGSSLLMGFFAVIVPLLSQSLADSPPTNKAHAILAELSDTQRNATLTKFIKKSGKNCDGVTKNFFQGFDSQGNAYWDAECRNKKVWVISLANDRQGSTKILGCDFLKTIGGEECFTKLK